MQTQTCTACGQAFKPSFVFQLAVSAGQRRYFCTLECRKRSLGDEAFRARRARGIAVLNQNALTYADEVVIPVTCDYLALVGVKQVMRTIKDIEKHLHHSVRIAGVLPTFFDGRVRLAREAYATLRDHFKTKCLEPIRQN